MYTGIAPQQDFFIYVPGMRKREEDAVISRSRLEQERNYRNDVYVELATWTRMALPGHLTIYTRGYAEREDEESA